jgi:hypothetical protein
MAVLQVLRAHLEQAQVLKGLVKLVHKGYKVILELRDLRAILELRDLRAILELREILDLREILELKAQMPYGILEVSMFKVRTIL